jgi:hypothetical protein
MGMAAVMRVPNDTPEQLKLGLIVLGILGVISILGGLKELVNHHIVAANLLWGLLLLGVSVIAWRKAFYY